MPAVSATDAVRVMVGTDRVLLVFGQIDLETAPVGLGAACDVVKAGGRRYRVRLGGLFRAEVRDRVESPARCGAARCGRGEMAGVASSGWIGPYPDVVGMKPVGFWTKIDTSTV